MTHRRAKQALWRQIRLVAELDLDDLEQEIRALEGEAEGDAYHLAGGLHARAQTQLKDAQTLADIRAVARLVAGARHHVASARAGEDLPWRAGCFFDPAHGRSARDVGFAPSDGAMERVPACAECATEVEAGRVPARRSVKVDGHSVPYWRDPAHIGYFGRTGETVDDLVVVAEKRRGDQSIGVFDWLDDWLSPV